MAYSRSESTLIKILPRLDPLAMGRATKWTVEDGQAWYWAGKVREALYIAREVFPGKYPELARVSQTFTVEVLDATTVQARPSGNTPVTAVGPSDGRAANVEAVASETTPVHGLELEGVPRQVGSMRSATDIIAYCLRALPTNDKLVFTDTVLAEAELDTLARWAQTRQPAWMVVVSASNRIVTLAPHQPGVPAWSPKAPVP